MPTRAPFSSQAAAGISVARLPLRPRAQRPGGGLCATVFRSLESHALALMASSMDCDLLKS